MKLGTQIGLGPGHTMSNGTQSPKTAPPNFRPMSLAPNGRPSQLLLCSFILGYATYIKLNSTLMYLHGILVRQRDDGGKWFSSNSNSGLEFRETRLTVTVSHRSLIQLAQPLWISALADPVFRWSWRSWGRGRSPSPREGRRSDRRWYWLSAQSERGAGDGRRQVQTLRDLSPQLLVDDLDQAALRHDQPKQLVQVQSLLRHNRDTIHRRTCIVTTIRCMQ